MYDGYSDDQILNEIKAYVSSAQKKVKTATKKPVSKKDMSPYARDLEAALPAEYFPDNDTAMTLKRKQEKILRAAQKKIKPTDPDELLDYYASRTHVDHSYDSDTMEAKSKTLKHKDAMSKVDEFVKLDQNVRNSRYSYDTYNTQYTDMAQYPASPFSPAKRVGSSRQNRERLQSLSMPGTAAESPVGGMGRKHSSSFGLTPMSKKEGGDQENDLNWLDQAASVPSSSRELNREYERDSNDMENGGEDYNAYKEGEREEKTATSSSKVVSESIDAWFSKHAPHVGNKEYHHSKNKNAKRCGAVMAHSNTNLHLSQSMGDLFAPSSSSSFSPTPFTSSFTPLSAVNSILPKPVKTRFHRKYPRLCEKFRFTDEDIFHAMR